MSPGSGQIPRPELSTWSIHRHSHSSESISGAVTSRSRLRPSLQPTARARSAIKARPAATRGGESAEPAPSPERKSSQSKARPGRATSGRPRRRSPETRSHAVAPPTHLQHFVQSIHRGRIPERMHVYRLLPGSRRQRRKRRCRKREIPLPRRRPFWEGIAFRLPWLRNVVGLFSAKETL